MTELPDLDEAARRRLRAAQHGVRAIGYVRSRHVDPAATPIQSLRNREEQGRLAIFPEFAEGLQGLADFDYAWVISWLDHGVDPAVTPEVSVVPFMLRHTGERLGVFATRYPARPNPLALSVVQVLGVEGSEVAFAGVDLCHGTPVLDIKPWQQDLDIPGYRLGQRAVAEIRGGWYERTGAAERGQLLPDGDDDQLATDRPTDG